MSTEAFIPHTTIVTFNDCLEFLPEAKRVLKSTRSFFRKIQVDSNLQLASAFFKEMASANEARLRNFDQQQKVQILFNAYIKSLMPLLEKAPVFDLSLKDLKRRFPLETEIDSSIQKLVLREINRLFVTFPQFAISYALDLRIEQMPRLKLERDSVMELKMNQQAENLLKELRGELACKSSINVNNQLQNSSASFI